MRSWPLTHDQVEALFQATGGGARGARNRAWLTMMYRGGLRIAEACSVQLSDVRGETDCYVVHVAKPKGWERGARPRDVAIGKPWHWHFEEWLMRRGADQGPFIRTPSGAALQTSYGRQLLPMLAKRAGIHRRVHPHALRHTFARELWQEGKDLLTISRALGHRSLATTAVYLESIGCSDVLDRLKER